MAGPPLPAAVVRLLGGPRRRRADGRPRVAAVDWGGWAAAVCDNVVALLVTRCMLTSLVARPNCIISPAEHNELDDRAQELILAAVVERYPQYDTIQLKQKMKRKLQVTDVTREHLNPYDWETQKMWLAYDDHEEEVLAKLRDTDDVLAALESLESCLPFLRDDVHDELSDRIQSLSVQQSEYLRETIARSDSRTEIWYRAIVRSTVSSGGAQLTRQSLRPAKERSLGKEIDEKRNECLTEQRGRFEVGLLLSLIVSGWLLRWSTHEDAGQHQISLCSYSSREA